MFQAGTKLVYGAARWAITLGLLWAAGGQLPVSARTARAGSELCLMTLSSRPEMVSGGDALVKVSLPAGGNGPAVRVLLNGTDVSSVFRAGPAGHELIGLVSDMKVGKNVLTATAGRASTTLTVTNYPKTGPIFSGPHAKPFFCQTEESGLGAPLDADCSLATRIYYVYRSTAPAPPVPPGTVPGRLPPPGGYPAASSGFKPLMNPLERPADLATVTLKDGQLVPYIVRVETGTINRAIYRIAVLDNPTASSMASWKPGASWNGKLLYQFGGSAGFGHRQGVLGAIGEYDGMPLSRGYAIATSTLNILATASNDVLSAETAMMVKEHFIKHYGVPRYTVGSGASGGSMQQHLITGNYPGILDGIMPSESFPDLTSLMYTVMDCALLAEYFGKGTIPWTAVQQLAVGGFGLADACVSKTGIWGKGAGFNLYAVRCGEPNRLYSFSQLPDGLQRVMYDPVKNPHGVRCTMYDSMITYFGADPKTGFARRPLDNVGIQYGLNALHNGTITPDQFLDLNENIGGFDIDGNFTAQRTVGDPEGIANAYRTGRTFSGKGVVLPILDLRTYQDVGTNVPIQGNHIHVKFHTFETRQRLIDANGTASNQIVWVWPWRGERAGEALDLIDQWLENLITDKSDTPYAAKVLKAKPARLVDGCWDSAGKRIDEPASMDPKSRCKKLFPIFGNPRLVAGEPVEEDITKCQLKPVDFNDYKASFTPEQQARLQKIFPGGVCDYSKPGVGQQLPVAKWPSFGPAPALNMERVAPARAAPP